MPIRKVISGLILSLLSLLFYQPAATAQEIYAGKEQRFNFRDGDFSVIGKLNNRVYAYRTTQTKYYIDVYDDTMRLIVTQPLEGLPKRVENIQFVQTNDKIHAFITNKFRGKIGLYTATLNKKGAFSAIPKLMHTEKQSWLKGENYYTTKISEDKSKILSICKGGRLKKSGIQTFIFDQELNILSQARIPLVNLSRKDKVALSNTQISNKGDVFVPLYQLLVSGVIKKASILKVPFNTSQLKATPLTSKGIYFSDLIIKINNKTEECIAAAFYKKGINIEGTFLKYINLNETQPPKEYYLPFPTSFLKTISKRGYRKSMNNKNFKELIFKKDGGFVLVAEHQQVQSKSGGGDSYSGFDMYYSNNRRAMGEILEYTYGDIIVMDYNNNRNIVWSEYIRKNQFTQDDNALFSSCSLLNTGAALVFIFNNFNKNSNAITIAAIDDKGKLQITNYNEAAARYDWVVKWGQQTENRAIVIPVLNRNKLGFNKIQF